MAESDRLKTNSKAFPGDQTPPLPITNTGSDFGTQEEFEGFKTKDSYFRVEPSTYTSHSWLGNEDDGLMVSIDQSGQDVTKSLRRSRESFDLSKLLLIPKDTSYVLIDIKR